MGLTWGAATVLAGALVTLTSPWWWVWVLTVGVLALALAWFVMVRARRLDRLHRRTENAARALSEQLLHRAPAATELALSGLLDPASAMLVHQAAARAVRAGGTQPAADADDPVPSSGLTGFGAAREDAESDLSRALRATLGELPPEHPVCRGPVTEDLAGACFRVRLARRLYNDAVAGALHVRRSGLVRLFRLAGRAPLPRTFEIDDEPAAILSSTQVPGGA